MKSLLIIFSRLIKVGEPCAIVKELKELFTIKWLLLELGLIFFRQRTYMLMDKLMLTEMSLRLLLWTGPQPFIWCVYSDSPVDGVVLMLPRIPEYDGWWWAIVLGVPSTCFLAWWLLERLSVKLTTHSPLNQHFLSGTAVDRTDELLESQETVSFTQTTSPLPATSMRFNLCMAHSKTKRWQSSKLLWNQDWVFKGHCPTVQCRKNGQ